MTRFWQGTVPVCGGQRQILHMGTPNWEHSVNDGKRESIENQKSRLGAPLSDHIQRQLWWRLLDVRDCHSCWVWSVSTWKLWCCNNRRKVNLTLQTIPLKCTCYFGTRTKTLQFLDHKCETSFLITNAYIKSETNQPLRERIFATGPLPITWTWAGQQRSKGPHGLAPQLCCWNPQIIQICVSCQTPGSNREYISTQDRSQVDRYWPCLLFHTFLLLHMQSSQLLPKTGCVLVILKCSTQSGASFFSLWEENGAFFMKAHFSCSCQPQPGGLFFSSSENLPLAEDVLNYQLFLERKRTWRDPSNTIHPAENLNLSTRSKLKSIIRLPFRKFLSSSHFLNTNKKRSVLHVPTRSLGCDLMFLTTVSTACMIE